MANEQNEGEADLSALSQSDIDPNQDEAKWIIAAGQKSSRLQAARVCLTYTFIASIYILFSDLVLAQFLKMEATITTASITKGLLFVLFTAVVLYIGVRRILYRERIASVNQALSQRRQNERFRSVVENLSEGVITIDEQGAIHTFNPAAEGIFGYGAEEVLGENVKILMPEPNRSAHDGYLSDFQKSGKGRFIDKGPQEVTALRKDGETFPMELSINHMRLGRQERYLAVVRDLSERKETEAKMQRSQRLQSIGRLTGGIAHDFNNLLQSLVATLEVLDDDKISPAERKAMLGQALQTTESGARLTRQLLTFSRQQPLSPESFDMAYRINEMLPLLRRTLREHIEIECHCEVEPAPVRLDPAQFDTAIMNLAVNARDAMPEGGTLRFEIREAELGAEDVTDGEATGPATPGRYFELCVSDTGVGMAPDTVEKIFDPFYTTKDPNEGTGLGLSMVFGFTKQSGGGISVYSEEGQGTIFRLYFPAVGEDSLRTHKPAVQLEAETGRGERVLVVEDSEPVRRSVVMQLRRLGYEPIEAEDGRAAIAVLEGDPAIDVLLTDVVMPGGISGYDLAARAEEMRPGIAVVITSGFPRGCKLDLPAGVHFLPKPYRYNDLAVALRVALTRQSEAVK